MGKKLPFSFEDADCGAGELRFYMNCCDEESPLLAHIEYPDNFDVLAEHINAEKFTVTLYWGLPDHCPPVAVYRAGDMSLLEKALAECVRRAERELAEKRFSYYGKLWDTEYIDVY